MSKQSPGDFSTAFSKLLQRVGVSRYQISSYSRLDQAYLSRLKSGKRCNPSRETILTICLALAHFGHINLYDVEELFKSAGWPLFLLEPNPTNSPGVKLRQNATSLQGYHETEEARSEADGYGHLTTGLG